MTPRRDSRADGHLKEESLRPRKVPSAPPSSPSTRNPSTASRKMLRTLKITGQSPAVSGRARRNVKDAAAETANSSPDVLIFH